VPNASRRRRTRACHVYAPSPFIDTLVPVAVAFADSVNVVASTTFAIVVPGAIPDPLILEPASAWPRLTLTLLTVGLPWLMSPVRMNFPASKMSRVAADVAVVVAVADVRVQDVIGQAEDRAVGDRDGPARRGHCRDRRADRALTGDLGATGPDSHSDSTRK
jgi:hypothetical protein